MDRATLENNIKKVFESDGDVLFAYLFGSHVTGLAHDFSDIDVACYVKPGDTTYYLEKEKKISTELSITLHSDKIDLCLLNVAPIVLKFNIITDGEVIISRDEQARIDFETDVLYKYFDFKPYLDEYHRLLKDKIRRVS